MKSRYVWITPKFHDELATRKSDDASVEVKLHVQLSAYDIPKSVEGSRTDDTFIIKFSYIDTEHQHIREEGGNGAIVLLVGKYSERLLGIEIDLKKLDLHDTKCILELTAKITDAIDQHSRHRGNFRAAKKVVEKKLGELVG